MPKYPARFAIALAGLVAALAIPAVPAAAQGMITLDHAVKNCRLIQNAAQRLACYDGVVDEANGGPPRHQSAMVPAPAAPRGAKAPSAPQTAAKAPAPPPAPKAEAQPAAPAPTSVAEAPSAKPETKPKSKGGLFSFFTDRKGDATAKIAKVGEWEDGSLALTTKEGAVWVQTDLTELNMVPRVGQTLTIAGTAFGGHLCQYGGSQLFKCARRK